MFDMPTLSSVGNRNLVNTDYCERTLKILYVDDTVLFELSHANLFRFLILFLVHVMDLYREINSIHK